MAFSADDLVNHVNNDPKLYESVVHHVKMLRHVLNRAAGQRAAANAEWHDDSEKSDHAAHHAAPEKQFPKLVRDKAIKDLVAYYLKELPNEQFK